MRRFSLRGKPRLRFLTYGFVGLALLVLLVSGWPIVQASPVFAPVSDTVPISTSNAESLDLTPSLNSNCNAGNILGCSNQLSIPGLPSCNVLAQLEDTLLGGACSYSSAHSQYEEFAGAEQEDSADNLATLLSDVLNVTSASISNLNATIQELLTYFESRAEQMAPEFLGTTFNQTIEDLIAMYSGLVPSIEGYEFAFGQQLYQDYNGTNVSWANIFGKDGTFGNYDTNLAVIISSAYGEPADTGDYWGSLANSYQTAGFNVSQPWQIWQGLTASGSSEPFLFNLGGGGAIVCANMTSGFSDADNCPTYTVTDLSTGTDFTVPDISTATFVSGNGVPDETTKYDIGPYDLLSMKCVSGCNSAANQAVEITNGYVFENLSSADPSNSLSAQYEASCPGGFSQRNPIVVMPCPDTGTYVLFLASGLTETSYTWVPTRAYNLCISLYAYDSPDAGQCYTNQILEGGIAEQLGSGPSAAVGGNASTMEYAQTMSSLFKNVMNTVYVYFTTLNTITDDGAYLIPADCTIPEPSNEFPSSLNPALYSLNTNEGLALYWAYLASVGTAFGTPYSTGLEFCGDPNLELSFNWTASWNLVTNITASVYVTGTNGSTVYLNGTNDSGEVYADPSTWAVVDANPTLLFPYEYTALVPVDKIYPISFNNPLALLLPNYTGNYGYGSLPDEAPFWGIPVYAQLSGYGNLTWDNGTLSNERNYFGRANASGDAIYISSCVVNGEPENPCDLSAVYFDHFTFGHVSGLVSPKVPGTGGFGGLVSQATAVCGTAGLNQWYDAWAGYVITLGATIFIYIGHAANSIPVVGGALDTIFTDLGCLIGYILLILVFVGLFIIIAYIVRVWRG